MKNLGDTRDERCRVEREDPSETGSAVGTDQIETEMLQFVAETEPDGEAVQRVQERLEKTIAHNNGEKAAEKKKPDWMVWLPALLIAVAIATYIFVVAIHR